MSAADPRTATRAQAALMFADTLETAGLSRENAGRLLGISRQLVDRKATGGPTLADVLDLIRGAPDAGAGLVRRLQEALDAARGRYAPPIEMAPRLCLLVASLVGEVCAECATSRVDRERVLELCAMAHAQIARLEACARGSER